MISTLPEDLADAPPSIQELVECAASLSLFDAVEEGGEGGREGGTVSKLLPRLVTVTQPMEEGPKEGEAQEEEEEEGEVVERRYVFFLPETTRMKLSIPLTSVSSPPSLPPPPPFPPLLRPRKESESLALAVNASLYWDTLALWGVFDSLNSTLQQEEEEGGREGGASMKKKQKQKQHFHHFYLPRKVEESEKTPVVQAEVRGGEGGREGGSEGGREKLQKHEVTSHTSLLPSFLSSLPPSLVAPLRQPRLC